MHLLEHIDYWANQHPDQAAHVNREQVLTYEKLRVKSNALSVYLKKAQTYLSPILVYGHKQNEMIISFLASVKSGHAYAPIDDSTPIDRFSEIIKKSGAKTILAITSLSSDYIKVVKSIDQDIIIINGLEEINKIISLYSGQKTDTSNYVKNKDVFYVIFTSGSTGTPKGVQITLNNLMSFLHWTVSAFKITSPYNFMNQAPFSFDLSVMDIYLALFTGGTIWSINRDMITNPKILFDFFSLSPIQVWVSTPSFAEFCLYDTSFCSTLLPKLNLFIFCGEVLGKSCAEKLIERFPKARLFNTYGPTETTVAVSYMQINAFILQKYETLPIGIPGENIEIFIEKNGRYYSCDSRNTECGEIIIQGDCVSLGYINEDEKTCTSFFRRNGTLCYKTGDIGYFKDKYLFYKGRVDNQIKIHGYRIEIEDIEHKLSSLSMVKQAVVIPQVGSSNQNEYLEAFVVLRKQYLEENLSIVVEIKKQLKQMLPSYMIPQKITICTKLPLTNNGKINRKALKAF